MVMEMQLGFNHLKRIDFGNLLRVELLGRRRGLKVHDSLIDNYLYLILFIIFLFLLRMNSYPRSICELIYALLASFDLENGCGGCR